MPTFPELVMRIASARAFWVVLEEPAGAVWNTIAPPAPVPVPWEPVIVKFAPAVLLVPPTTFCTPNVCATGEAASARPR